MGEHCVEGLTDREASLKAIAAVKNLIGEVGLPYVNQEIGGRESDFPANGKICFGRSHTAHQSRQASLEDLIGIYRLAY